MHDSYLISYVTIIDLDCIGDPASSPSSDFLNQGPVVQN